jgi:hypothetical protein
MSARGGIALAAATLFIAAMPAGAQADTPWTIGAAKVDTTPALFTMGQDLQDFPEVDPARQTTCPRATYNGLRLWRFEEPYQDTDGSESFNYPISGDPGSAPAPEPFCDYNHNNRWDGIYLSGGADHQAVPSPNPIDGYSGPAHDPIDARAIAVTGDNGKTVALVSVVAQGIFENYIGEARAKAMLLAGQGPHQQSCGHIDEMVVSSNHNESSPDTIGLYGAPEDPTGSFGVNSGIDEYYMDWLDDQMAQAAVEACDNREPASLREVEFPVPSGLRQEIHAWPTTARNGEGVATDPKVRVLQARDAGGDSIFTMMNLADHNQDIGQSDTYEESHTMSADWPGYFHRRLEQDVGGMAMFLAADIGSMEDLITVPAIPGPPCNSGANGCYAQVELTGNTIADDVAAELPNAAPIPAGPVNGQRTEFCSPLENNLFRAAFEAGIFGERQAYTNCQPTGKAGNEVHTSVALLDVGPQLQFIVNPGEAFPGLMLGNPWGIEDASCPRLANPPVPTWHASARYRFQVGLGDDLIGYEKPAWSFLLAPPEFSSPDCNTDPRNHSHSLESEAVGPTASNMVAEKLTDLLDQNPDPTAEIRIGRFVKADGTLTDPIGTDDQVAPGHFPKDAVAIWLATPGFTTLTPQPGEDDSGTIVALPNIGSFGTRPVDANGVFMDFDGAEETSGPDVMTRGMLVKAGDGSVQKRYYVNVYPSLAVTGSLGPAVPRGYPRPKGATPLRASLALAYEACTSPNRTHGAPLSMPSCSPPRQASSFLTVGTLDANGAAAKAVGLVRYDVQNNVSPTPSDVAINVATTDVRCKSAATTACGGANAVAGPDYAGALQETTMLRITDRHYSPTDTGTTADVPFPVAVPCVATADTSSGSTCSISTSANSVSPGSVNAGDGAIWQLSQVEVYDGGSTGTAGASDATLFEDEGIFIP